VEGEGGEQARSGEGSRQGEEELKAKGGERIKGERWRRRRERK
jgi:hypothetical protein